MPMMPDEPTPEMLNFVSQVPTTQLVASAFYRAMVAARPKWQPTDEQVERFIYAYRKAGNVTMFDDVRAALIAAMEGP